MLRLYVQAPFAVFRTFSAGWYRPTAGFLTPSAAYGLALNLAGVESRRDDGLSAMTVTQFGLPRARIALGAVGVEDDRRGWQPTVHTIFQQLHNYPVGASGKERKGETKGSKYNITPVRREFLADLRAVVALDFPDRPDVEAAIRRSLDPGSAASSPRYGLPFLGDNAFLIDKLKVADDPIAASWYELLGSEGDDSGQVPYSTRLTIWIDRQDMSRTKAGLFAPLNPPSVQIPEAAWTSIDPPPEPNSKLPATRPGKKG